MSSFPCRCLLALFGVLLFSASAGFAGTPWEAVFPAAGGESRSVAFPVGDGRYFVAVAHSGAQGPAGKLKSGDRVIPAESFTDPVSTIVVFRITGPAEKAMPLAAAPVFGKKPGLFHAGGGTGRATGWIKQINGKMLPLSLLRVEYSGGVPLAGTPLTDSKGEVVAIAHQASGDGAGYALPVDVVKRVMADVQGKGKVCRAWLGLKLRPEAKVPQVTSVQGGSPSATAGVREGDVLLQVGARDTPDYADAVNAFFFLRPGVPADVKLKRGDEVLSVSVTPEEKGGE